MNHIIHSSNRIEKIEWGCLPGKRSRPTGKNAVLDEQGDSVPMETARITIAGQTGFGWSVLSKDQAESLIGLSTTEIFTADGKVRPEYMSVEYPLLDWLGNSSNQPVYSLFKREELRSHTSAFAVDCYDTSLYFDEVNLSDEKAAVELMQEEVAAGIQQGHRSFKIKVGRGARHMPLELGTQRDIAVIRGVREAAGVDARIMIDANNAYNLNLTKQVLAAVAEVSPYWIEEPFHENNALYKDLKQWIHTNNLNVMIADGEWFYAPPLVEWALQGCIDVVQHDIRDFGFCRWLDLGKVLDSAGIQSAPHNYHSAYGNYASCHLASAVKGFLFVEWDDIAVTGLDASGYSIAEGKVNVPAEPGFGLKLDDSYFSRIVKENGWTTS
jgi:L-rhamnonate dehydratase